MNTTSSGNRAEQAVAEELTRRGYRVIELNWKTRFAEIDIVAEKDRTLCFVEVKYRRTEAAGDGFDYITSQKLHHMQRAAESYVLTHDWTGEYRLLAASATGGLDNLHIQIVEV